MSLIGSSVMVLTSTDQWRMAIVRASSQALLSNSDLTHIRVLLEWVDYSSGVPLDCQDEWVSLGKQELFKCVYLETTLLWAKRVLLNEDNRAVAWPARAFAFLCGSTLIPSHDILIVEYLLDKEKVQLSIHETKELQLAEAKATLSQQPHLLQELHKWEELAHGRDLLQKCPTSLKGYRVRVYNVQLHKSWISGVVVSVNCHSKELVVLDDRTQAMLTVNPHLIQVLLQQPQEDGQSLSLPTGQWGTPPLSLVNSPDISVANGSPGVTGIKSPHLTSPVIQECPSPQFNLTSSGKSSLYFGSTSSKDISASNGGGGLGLGQVTLQDRRSSLQQRNVSVIRSEPNISRRCSLDPVTLKRLSEPFGFSQDLPGMQSHSLSRLPFHCNSSGNSSAAVPTTPSNVGGAEGRGFQQQMQPHPLQSSCSPHGSNSHLSMHGGSNPQLNSLHGSNSSIGGAGGGIGGVMGGDDMNLPLGGGSDGNRGSGEFYPTPEDIIKQTDRSQSLGNIYSSVHNQLGNQYQHHSHHHHNHMPTHHQQGGSDGLMSGLHPQRSSVGVSMINSSTSNLSPPAPAPPTQGMPGGTTHRRSSDSPLQTYQKRKHSGYGATSRGMAKKPRFDVTPDMDKSGDVLTGALRALSRSASQPAVFPSKNLERKLKDITGGVAMFGEGDSQQKHEDDLDIIKQIIEDESMHSSRPPAASGGISGGEGMKGLGTGGKVGEGNSDGGDGLGLDSPSFRSQSLVHIPNQFSFAGSLPSLHHAEDMHILHANYNSAPDLPQFSRASNQQGGGSGSNSSSTSNLLLAVDPPIKYNLPSASMNTGSSSSLSGSGMYSNSSAGGLVAEDGGMLGGQRRQSKLQAVSEDQLMVVTSLYNSVQSNNGTTQASRVSMDLGHPPPPHLPQQQQHQQSSQPHPQQQQQSQSHPQQQQHRHSFGGRGAGSRDGCHHPIAMTRSASLSAASYSPGYSSLLPTDHTLSNSNPSLALESSSSMISHYPSNENISSASLESLDNHAPLGGQTSGSGTVPAPPPPATTVGRGMVSMVTNGGGQSPSASAGMEGNMMGHYLGSNGVVGNRNRSYSEVEIRVEGGALGELDHGAGFCDNTRRTSGVKDPPAHPPTVATEAIVLSAGEAEDSLNGEDMAEYAISKVINSQFSGTEDTEEQDLLYSPDPGSSELMASFPSTTVNSLTSTPLNMASNNMEVDNSQGKKGRKPKKPKKVHPPKENPRSRGRPRLTEEEKQRRKELRELGLLKRSRRRTKEEVAQWKAERVMTPAKRGRKPGSGKKNIVKAASGKVVFVSVDLSKFTPGTVLLQNGFCRAYPGVPKCLDCGTCEGDLPSSKYCRFLEFRKLLIESVTDARVTVYGFSDYMDVVAPDLVHWTPLKTNYSRMEESTALFILHKIANDFVLVMTEQAKTLPEADVVPVWKRPVSGLRELCDTCDTSLFNFHWVCQSCGFCICPACYHIACNTEDEVEAVSSMQTSGWPACVAHGEPHQPTSLVLAQIIPANVLSEVVMQVLSICKHYKVQVSVPDVLQRLYSTVSQQVPQTKYQNDLAKKTRAQPTTGLHTHQNSPNLLGPSDSLPHPLLPSHFTHHHQPHPHSQSPPLGNTNSSSSSPKVNSIPTSIPLSMLPPNCTGPLDIPPIELPHSCSNGNEDLPETEPFSCPHQWLCDGTLLCLLDAKHNENITAFQDRWRRSQPVLVFGVDKYLDKELWTPQAFSREFGEELADLVDCRIGLHLLQLPSKTFWDGFENMSARLHDPTKNEPRLLKLKDWPTGDDFSEKLPRRFNDIMSALPLPDYTRRDGKYNMASSLPKFFVKPDLGPKMYNAYGSPLYSNDGTTNLHLDISSAVNVMVYCNIPPSAAGREWEMIEDLVRSECCPQTLHRIQQTGAKPGALWQIYSPSDADKIRAFLRKVYEEKGFCMAPGSDAIHDQLIYLNLELRERLLQEYGVKGWTILQCVGDAVFIPAGAPHQVRNLCSCIKVAEDFVSPEHVYQCLKLTDEFRHLSDHHSNHEDKLQIKNILYHSIKDIVGALKSSLVH